MSHGPHYDAAIAIRKANPCATLQDIGDKLGVSRERVRQILAKEQYPTRHFVQKYICQQCGTLINKRRRFCSVQCRHDYTHPLVECSQCGKQFRRAAKLILNTARNPRYKGRLFCSRHCQFRWYGLNRGFHAHPENIGPSPKVRHYDYEIVWRTHLETGYGISRLSELLQIPKGTIAMILRVMSKESTKKE